MWSRDVFSLVCDFTSRCINSLVNYVLFGWPYFFEAMPSSLDDVAVVSRRLSAAAACSQTSKPLPPSFFGKVAQHVERELRSPAGTHMSAAGTAMLADTFARAQWTDGNGAMGLDRVGWRDVFLYFSCLWKCCSVVLAFWVGSCYWIRLENLVPEFYCIRTRPTNTEN